MYKSGKIIRKEFIDYFSTELDHKLIPSSSVIPWCDSSVPFVNAGMNQFKGIFLGYHDPPASKVTNHQKCIRVGGKHNDLNDVGHDTYHHTFFEMLGNWSFGSYGKEAACNYAWSTLTRLYGINKNNLYVTYFGGDKKLNIDPDFECREIWRKIGLSDDKIRPCSDDNFWEMDLFGPCGPCTEIHIDRNYSINNNINKLQQKQVDELTELWNIVFINHQRLKNGSVVPLEKQFIDTGMGFERLVAVLQNKKSNYDTDIFQPLFQAIHDKSHAPVYRGNFGADDVNKLDTNYRILADHARMITVALADGMIPEKNHKLRRVLRRALTIAIEIFKADNLLSELNYHVAESLGDVYPEIIKNLNQIQTIVNYEKDLLISQRASAGKQWENLIKMKPELVGISDPFAAGLINAYKELQTIIKNNNNNFSVLPGKIAFKFYDTYGLDLEAIKELAEIEDLSVDEQGFHDYFESVKINSRIGSTKNKRKFISPITVDQLKNNNIPKTDDYYKYKYTFDNKYKFDPLECSVVGVIIDGNLVTDKIVRIDETQFKSGEIGLVLDKTPFYANEGGQLSDKGLIKVNNLKFNITDVEKSQDYVIHYGNFDRETNIELSTNDKVIATIDGEYRTGLMMNHTATHLLNAGLRKIFPAIAQRASVVTNRDLIFKFSTYGIKFMPQHRLELDSLVNKCINKKTNVETKSINMFELTNEKNLTLIPGEIYPDTNLRIVNIQGDLISKEACCGTHVHNTGVLENFSIIDVTPKSSSQYIIKAVTKSDAKKSNNNNKNSNETTPIKINYLDNVKSSDDKKKIVAAFMKSEIEKALENKSGPFIVHCLESNDIEAESVPLQKAVDFCNLPMFLIVMSKKKLKVRCFVPKDYQSSSFNAELWMDSIKTILPIKLGSFQDEDVLETCHTKILKIPRDKIKHLTDNAVTEAEKFASLYFKSKINKK
ncbi:alanine--tRNA ligase, mitochondrial [Microplitis demolitor]|uniref:alanine--tRNA ligase, mitochondrial n=1 Tax=Microplitis demolitor TaxID=69319 RepID=UPI0004CD4F27|nr:alanine--tRNA ligase, mitochondrial [Microplitis demolitor]